MTETGTGLHLSYEQAKRMACDPDREQRLLVAANEDIAPEILYFMVDDPDAEIRRVVAANVATPRQADGKLANDEDANVRKALASKIAQEAALEYPQQPAHASLTSEILDILAKDQLPVVRQVLAEVLKSEARVPYHVVQRLARDIDIVVAAPVLEFSPLLCDSDLLEIIEGSPVDGALSAISRRDGVSNTVSASIVSSDDSDAILTLLKNPTAQFREDTLDDLIEKSRTQEVFQEPLVLRPKLPALAACKLATFVADSLLDVLQNREDLDQETMEAVRSSVHERLTSTFEQDPGVELSPERVVLKREYESALTLHQKAPLTETVVNRSLDYEHWDFVIATIAVMSETTLDFTVEVFESHMPELVGALCWRAGISVETARLIMELQLHYELPLAYVEATEYPASKDIMEGELDLFAREHGLTMKVSS